MNRQTMKMVKVCGGGSEQAVALLGSVLDPAAAPRLHLFSLFIVCAFPFCSLACGDPLA